MLGTDVLWFGALPQGADAAEWSTHHLRLLNGIGIGDDIDRAEAAVFWLGSELDPQLAEAFKANVRRLLDHGIRVEVIASGDRALGELQALAATELATPGVGKRTGQSTAEIVQALSSRRRSSKPSRTLAVEMGDREPLSQCDELLLRRAFDNRCSRVVLAELTEGRSGARVFAAHMTVIESEAGVRPQPAFVKIDRRDKILQEYDNYRNLAQNFIPFGQRPNIHSVVEGADRALLRGDFVDRSESLADLARRMVAAQAITSLMEDTLAGWRDQAYSHDPVAVPVAKRLHELNVFSPDRLRPRYPEQAAGLGITVSLADAWQILTSLPQRYRRALAHGDLHGENVRVRNGQAILIDLASVLKEAPLTTDLAALETWMAFEVLPNERERDEWRDPVWEAEIDRLYAPDTFAHPPGPPDPTGSLCWMGKVVRQLRQMGIAAQSCPTEYQAAVAVQLLRRCQWDDGRGRDRSRRLKGYIVAMGLIGHLKESAL